MTVRDGLPADPWDPIIDDAMERLVNNGEPFWKAITGAVAKAIAQEAVRNLPQCLRERDELSRQAESN